MSRKYWFASKFGFGWYPVSFKGAAVLVLYFSYLIYTFLRLDANSHSLSDTLVGIFPHFFASTVILLFVCYLTGEPIRRTKLKI